MLIVFNNIKKNRTVNLHVGKSAQSIVIVLYKHCNFNRAFRRMFNILSDVYRYNIVTIHYIQT